MTVVDCETETACVCATLGADDPWDTVSHTVRANYESDATSLGSEIVVAPALVVQDASVTSGEVYPMSNYADCPVEAVLERWVAATGEWLPLDASDQPASTWLSLNSENELVVLPG